MVPCNMLCTVYTCSWALITYLHRVNSVTDDTQHVKTRHDGLRQVHVFSEGQGRVVPAACKEMTRCLTVHMTNILNFDSDFTLCYSPMGLEAAMTVHLA